MRTFREFVDFLIFVKTAYEYAAIIDPPGTIAEEPAPPPPRPESELELRQLFRDIFPSVMDGDFPQGWGRDYGNVAGDRDLDNNSGTDDSDSFESDNDTEEA